MTEVVAGGSVGEVTWSAEVRDDVGCDQRGARGEDFAKHGLDARLRELVGERPRAVDDRRLLRQPKRFVASVFAERGVLANRSCARIERAHELPVRLFERCGDPAKTIVHGANGNSTFTGGIPSAVRRYPRSRRARSRRRASVTSASTGVIRSTSSAVQGGFDFRPRWRRDVEQGHLWRGVGLGSRLELLQLRFRAGEHDRGNPREPSNS